MAPFPFLFHHLLSFLHSPTRSWESGQQELPQVARLLRQISTHEALRWPCSLSAMSNDACESYVRSTFSCATPVRNKLFIARRKIWRHSVNAFVHIISSAIGAKYCNRRRVQKCHDWLTFQPGLKRRSNERLKRHTGFWTVVRKLLALLSR